MRRITDAARQSVADAAVALDLPPLGKEFTGPWWQVAGIVGVQAIDRYLRGDRLALTTTRYKCVMNLTATCVPEQNVIAKSSVGPTHCSGDEDTRRLDFCERNKLTRRCAHDRASGDAPVDSCLGTSADPELDSGSTC